ncbi:MAG: hypothetical protein R6X08_07615 [Desulfosalsimonadaceae bacterium]
MKRLTMTAAILCLAGFILGCGARWARSPVVKSRDMQVSLEKQQTGEQGYARQFQHPFDMDADRLKIFLEQLRYKKDSLVLGKAQELPVFDHKEIDRLAPAMAEALAKAGPKQRVRFISYNKGGVFLFQKTRRTGGVMFVDTAGRLNLAFSYVNYVIKDKEIKTTYTKKLYSDPLQENTADTSVLGPEYVSHYRSGGGEKPWWLVADASEVGRLETPAVQEQETAVSPEPAEVRKEDARQKQAPSGKKARKTAPELEAGDEKTGGDTGTEAWSRRKKEVREKLEYLKDLHESDLISSEEYKAQKQQVLEELR